MYTKTQRVLIAVASFLVLGGAASVLATGEFGRRFIPISAAPSNCKLGDICEYYDSGDTALYVTKADGTKVNLLSVGGGYTTVQDEGSNLTARSKINFIGSGITCVDNSGSTRTDCTVSTSSSCNAGSGTPSVGSFNANLGTVTSASVTGNGCDGKIAFTTGTVGAYNGADFTVTPSASATNGYACVLYAGNSNQGVAWTGYNVQTGPYVTSNTTTWTLNHVANNPWVSSTAYVILYHCGAY